ncbi:MAG: terminase gpA endonuclease subunit [Aeromonas sp.]
MFAKASRVRRDVAALVRPPDRRPLSQLLPEILRIDQGGVMAPIDMDLTGYMREPADCLKSRRYTSVIFCGPARTGKSLSLVEGFLMDSAAKTRADTLLVHVSQQRAAEFSKKNFSRSARASQVVREALSTNKHDNGIHLIKLKAGNFINIGWPSVNTLSSQTYHRVIVTDVDRMPEDIGGEGSVLHLAKKRIQTVGTSGMMVAESSPGLPVTDPSYRPLAHEAPPTGGILAAYNEGDRRLFHWQCVDGCREWFEPVFDLLVYDKDEPDPAKAASDVSLACPFCGTAYREGQPIEGEAFKLRANRTGLWVPEGCYLDPDGTLHGTPRETDTASFWLRGGVAAAFQSWGSLVTKYVTAWRLYEATGLTEDLKTVTNVDLGLPFIPPRTTERSANALANRREELGVKVVPPWVRFLIASVDVQGGKNRRFEVHVRGFGAGLRSVVIDRFKIEKSRRIDPDDPEKFVRVKPGTYAEDWDLLTEKVIGKTYEIDDGSGRHMAVLRTACDSAGEDGVTDQAYAYWRRLKAAGLHRRFKLIKGASRPMTAAIEEKRPDNTGRKDRKAVVWGDVPVLFLNTNRLKDLVSASLDRDTVGDRYCHFPNWLPESYFDELVAEERDLQGKWEKVSPRNEAFDLMAYEWAMLIQLKADKITDWDNPPPWAETIDNNPEVLASPSSGEPAPKTRRRRRTS